MARPPAELTLYPRGSEHSQVADVTDGRRGVAALAYGQKFSAEEVGLLPLAQARRFPLLLHMSLYVLHLCTQSSVTTDAASTPPLPRRGTLSRFTRQARLRTSRPPAGSQPGETTDVFSEQSAYIRKNSKNSFPG